VLYIHPFAEEMNKSRRMAALQSRALAATGYDVLQIDLLGCGDSSGDFGDASWQAWREDVLAGYRSLRERSTAPLVLWGLRAGCLLAAETATELPEAADFIFWQPVVSGKQHWQQFMRLKMAGEMASGQAKAVGEQPASNWLTARRLKSPVMAFPALAQGLEQAELKPPAGRTGRVVWLETSLRDEPTLAPVARNVSSNGRPPVTASQARVAHGPAFWQTTEIEDAPQLIAATLAGLEVRA
jgi:exosortase A-associated hydrolase 2